MPHLEVEHIVVRACDAFTSWRVSIDLTRGAATSERFRVPGLRSHPIDDETLATLSDEAERAAESGDFEHRDQFADGELWAELRMHDRTVTVRYITAGSGPYARIATISAFALECVRD